MDCPHCGRAIAEDSRLCPACGADLVSSPVPRPRRRLGPRLKNAAAGYVFLLPNILGFLTFTLGPVVAAFLLSFTQWDAVSDWRLARPVGLQNYQHFLGFQQTPQGVRPNDPEFWQYLGNTVFLMSGIPLGMVLSLLLALLLDQRLRGVVVFRTVYFLPSICAAVALAMLWKWVYAPEFGLANEFLRKLHVVTDGPGGLLNAPLEALGLKQPGDPLKWLLDPSVAKPALILVWLWAGIGGYNCILYLAGLQNIPRELYEAAEMDGAGWWPKLRFITWPQLAPTTFFILTMSIIGGLQGGFAHIHIMTGGGPAGATTNVLYYIYNHAFQWFKMGQAAALAMILFAIIFVLTLINWKYGRSSAAELQ